MQKNFLKLNIKSTSSFWHRCRGMNSDFWISTIDLFPANVTILFPFFILNNVILGRD